MTGRLRSLLTAVLGGLLLFTGVVAAAPANASLPGGGSCPKVILMVARGTTEPAGQGDLHSLAVSIDKSTSSSVATYSVSYPATAAFPAYWDSVAAGEKNLRSQLTSLVANCPSAKVALLGYSQGAHVIGDTIDDKGTQLPAKVKSAIKAVVFYGDPTFVAGKSYDRGTYHSGESGAFPRGSSALSAFSSRIHSWCDANDLFCQSGGLSKAVHGGYFSRYNTAATTFVDGKLGL
jgi:acetylxylan esterase